MIFPSFYHSNVGVYPRLLVSWKIPWNTPTTKRQNLNTTGGFRFVIGSYPPVIIHFFHGDVPWNLCHHGATQTWWKAPWMKGCPYFHIFHPCPPQRATHSAAAASSCPPVLGRGCLLSATALPVDKGRLGIFQGQIQPYNSMYKYVYIYIYM